jgi:hypothetical protein
MNGHNLTSLCTDHDAEREAGKNVRVVALPWEVGLALQCDLHAHTRLNRATCINEEYPGHRRLLEEGFERNVKR